MSDQSVQMSDADINEEILCIKRIHDINKRDGFCLDLISFARAIESRILAAQSKQQSERIGTHSNDCHTWGTRHYECLLRKYEELLAAQAELQQSTVSQDDCYAIAIHADGTQTNMNEYDYSDWPERIYLQRGEDEAVPFAKASLEDTYWCQDQQFDSDVPYIRADIALQSPSTNTVKQDDGKDAARYRYLRDKETLDARIWAALEGVHADDANGYAAALDETIDMAIAQQGDGKDAAQNLSPLPEMALHSFVLGPLFSAKQMESYARLAAAISSMKTQGE